MKKLSSIVGVGVISMAVALSPAFAQQTTPTDPAAKGSTVQPKAEQKAPVTNPAAKDEKAKTAPDTKSQPSTPAKPQTDAKAGAPAAPSVKPDVKAQPQTAPVKPGADVKVIYTKTATMSSSEPV